MKFPRGVNVAENYFGNMRNYFSLRNESIFNFALNVLFFVGQKFVDALTVPDKSCGEQTV